MDEGEAMARDSAIVKQIIRRYGKVIDIEKQPDVIIDIIRQFAPELADDGGVPAGVPPSPPPPPPGPTSFQPGDPTLRDVLKEVLKISRELTKIRKQLDV
jgi:hypothetical protein